MPVKPSDPDGHGQQAVRRPPASYGRDPGDVMAIASHAKVVGADVVEVLPDRDVSGITALLASQVMFEILCLDAATRA